jgi:hypothetical protein
LDQLPLAVNEIEMDIPNIEEDEESADEPWEDGPTGESVEAEKIKKSKVVERNLPRLSVMNFLNSAVTNSVAEQLFQKEAIALCIRDALDSPNKTIPRPTRSQVSMAANRGEFSLEELKNAESLITAAVMDEDIERVRSNWVIPNPRPESPELVLKRLESITKARDTLRTQMLEKFKESEDMANKFDTEFEACSLAIADLTRRIRARKLVEPKRQSDNQALLDSVLEKVQAEKFRNKHHQDRYMRLASFVKKMTTIISNAGS